MTKAQSTVQERFLSEMCREKKFLRVFLVSGVRLEGYIKSFDNYVIYLEEPVPQIVYKSAICSVFPVDRNKYSALPNKTLDGDVGIPTYESVDELFKKRGFSDRRVY